MTVPWWVFWPWLSASLFALSEIVSLVMTRWEHDERLARAKSDAMYWEDVAKIRGDTLAKLATRAGLDVVNEQEPV